LEIHRCHQLPRVCFSSKVRNGGEAHPVLKPYGLGLSQCPFGHRGAGSCCRGRMGSPFTFISSYFSTSIFVILLIIFYLSRPSPELSRQCSLHPTFPTWTGKSIFSKTARRSPRTQWPNTSDVGKAKERKEGIGEGTTGAALPARGSKHLAGVRENLGPGGHNQS